jgi:GTP-binding protein
MKQALIDHVEFRVRAGNGGAGSVHFLRNRMTRKGGPDGGDGGNGGSIYFLTNPHMTTLLDYAGKDHFEAVHGERGQRQKMHGKDADDLIVEVPVGTVVFARIDAEGNHSPKGEWQKLFDLDKPNEKAMIARGGAGGRGNTAFKSSVNTTPMTAEPGQWGEEKFLKLEMKILADVGLVGLPNAGKSTLLSVLTAAHPEIANYPFTTISPNLGVLEDSNSHKQLIIADIPGLIEDAHKGKGLGIDFLKHIERCRKLVYVLSLTDADLSAVMDCTSVDDQKKAITTALTHQFEVVHNEVLSYGNDVDMKPRMIVINKIDVLPDFPEVAIKAVFENERVYFVSAATKQQLEPLVEALFVE